MTSQISDNFKTHKVRDKEVEKDQWSLVEVPDHFKTQEMCNKAVEKDPCSLLEVPDHFKTDSLSSQKKFTIFTNSKFSKKLRYSIIF